MAEDPNFNEFGTNINKAGIAFNLIYESRDVIVNACKGLFFRPSSIFGVSKIMKFLMLTLGSAKLYIDGETH